MRYHPRYHIEDHLIPVVWNHAVVERSRDMFLKSYELWSLTYSRQVTESLAARSDRLLAAATAAAELAQPMAPSKAPGLLARAANLRRKPFGGDNSGGISSGDGGPWEALDEVVREALREAFAIADKEFIATSSLPEVCIVA